MLLNQVIVLHAQHSASNKTQNKHGCYDCAVLASAAAIARTLSWNGSNVSGCLGPPRRLITFRNHAGYLRTGDNYFSAGSRVRPWFGNVGGRTEPMP
jgi:hypothetical protein